MPIQQSNRPTGRADAADDQKSAGVGAGVDAEVELPATVADERPERAIMRCLGLNGGQFAVPLPDQLLANVVQLDGVARRLDFPSVVGDPDRHPQASEARAETASRLMISLARFGTTRHRQQDVLFAARPRIVWTLEHRLDDFEPWRLGEERLRN